MKRKFLIFPFVFFFFLALSALAQEQPSVCDWRGYIKIDGVLADNTTIITSYTNNASATNGTVFSGGYYVIPVPGTLGDNITFKVFGVAVNESAQTWSCDAPGYNILNLTMNKTAAGTACTYAQGCTGGYCVHGYCSSSSTYCGDGYCDSGESCSADNSACSSGYECTNGCVAVSVGAPAPAPVPPAEETETIPSIPAGSTETVTFSKEDELGVQKIEITAKDTVSNVEITVKKETTKPAAVTTPPGIVHSYLTFTATNIEDENITTAKIKFKVSQTWVSDNNVNKTTVALNRYTTKWDKLSTSLVNEDSSYAYYEAITPGFSVFSITAVVITAPVVICTPAAKQCVGNDLQECNLEGTAWVTLETCTYGCNTTTLACNPAPVVPPVQICTPEEKKCVGNNLQQCNLEGTAWTTVETCLYGCNVTTLACNPKPVVPPKVVDYTWLWVIIIIIIVLIGIGYWYKTKMM